MDAPAVPVLADLADVDPLAVCVLKRTLLRHHDRVTADPMDDYLARVIVARLTAMLAADLAPQPASVRPPTYSQ